MSVKEEIKTLLVQSNIKLKELAEEMTKRTGKNYSSANISQKLSRKTLKYEEAKLIGEILGYKLEFFKIKNSR